MFFILCGGEKIMKKYKISIIIPVYNAEKYIERCINSFLNQSYQNFELLLIDDGSSDNSLSICKSMQKCDDRIYVFQGNHGGVSAARNIGLEKAKGDIISFCDADDFISENTFDTIIEVMDSQNIDIIVFGMYIASFRNGKLEIQEQRTVSKEEKWTAGDLIEHVFYNDVIMGSVWNKFFSKKILKGLHFDESLSYCEDTHFLIGALTRNRDASIRILPKPLYYYIQNLESVTNNAEYLFSKEGLLKYNVSMRAILHDYKLLKAEYRQVRKKMFSLASDVYLNFNLSDYQNKILKKDMKDNFWFYICTPPFSMVTKAKKILKTIKKVIFLQYKAEIKIGECYDKGSYNKNK